MLVHPYPVVTQSDLNILHFSFVLNVDGASLHSNTLQWFDYLSNAHGPSLPIRPMHPYSLVYLTQGIIIDTQPFPLVIQFFKKAEHF